MLAGILAGTLMGLAAGLAPGPLLALVVAQTIKHGFKEGMRVSCSPLLSDLPIVALCYWVLSRMSPDNQILQIISLLGGIYVLYLAWETWNWRRGTTADPGSRPPRSLLKGAVVNLLNPHPYLFWTTVGIPLTLRLGRQSFFSAVAFVATFYLFLVGSKISLAAILARSRNALEGRAYGVLMQVLAVLLALFAGLLIKDWVSGMWSL
jgi:threonine/homoserine/homoserine lactone efflux protein